MSMAPLLIVLILFSSEISCLRVINNDTDSIINEVNNLSKIKEIRESLEAIGTFSNDFSTFTIDQETFNTWSFNIGNRHFIKQALIQAIAKKASMSRKQFATHPSYKPFPLQKYAINSVCLYRHSVSTKQECAEEIEKLDLTMAYALWSVFYALLVEHTILYLAPLSDRFGYEDIDEGFCLIQRDSKNTLFLVIVSKHGYIQEKQLLKNVVFSDQNNYKTISFTNSSYKECFIKGLTIQDLQKLLNEEASTA